jgi:hypothetical protein
MGRAHITRAFGPPQSLPSTEADDPTITPGAWEAVVQAVSEDGVVIRVLGYDSRHDFGPCPYLPREPEVGDSVLAIFSDDREPWVLVAGTPALPPAEPPSITGSRASGAALVSLLAAGEALGLWTDDTTA